MTAPLQPSNSRWPGASPWSGCWTLLGAGSTCARLVMFHGIGGAAFSADSFERLLRQVGERFDLVSIDEALDRAGSTQPRQRPCLALTFDDGLWNHAEVAFPLLRKYQAPAVFYVCPGLMDSGSWLWPHEARQRLRSLDPPRREAWAATHQLADAEPNAVVTAMKGLANAERVELLASIRSATPGYAPDANQKRQFDVMSWDQLRGLDPRWITIGSHTMSHPIMTSLPAAELEYELQASRARLEEGMQRPIEHFCYPNGSENPAVRAAAARHYRTAVTTEPGYLHADTDRLGIPRVDGDPRRAKMTWNLFRPYPPR